jgi:prolyl 4-hydroxylase
MPKWIHVGRYASPGEAAEVIEQTPQVVPKQPGECDDMNENCDAWSVSGECEKNPGYMIGTVERPGACLKACGRCDILKEFEKKHRPEAQATATQRRLGRRLQ